MADSIRTYLERFRQPALAGLLALLISPVTIAGSPVLPTRDGRNYSLDIEQQLQHVFNAIRTQRLPEAAALAESLAGQYPDFSLGQLLHAEMQSLLALSPMLLASDHAWSPRLVELLMEAQTRVRQTPLASADQLPFSVVQLGNDMEHLVAVDLEQSRLFLIDNRSQQPRVISEHYTASGRGGYGKRMEGDLRTPTGIYRVTGRRPGSTLPPLYGSGALTLDYPNALDRHYQRTGSGIWLHGIPDDSLSRPPRSSEGCVAMPNDLLSELYSSIDPKHTLVLLSGRLHWASTASDRPDRAEALALFEQWREAWGRPSNLQLQTLYSGRWHSVSSRTDITPPLTGLTELEPAAVTILHYPPFPGSQAAPQLLMRFTLGPDAATAHTITLYWERSNDLDWRIVEISDFPPSV